MSSQFGISGGGRSSEDLFRQLTGAERPAKASLGDAVVDGHPVEIKSATKPTLNQVRAVKFIPLIVHDVPRDEWYVVPAHEVVKLVASKGRGQHTENPFESATLNLGSLSGFKVEKARLRAAVVLALEAGNQHPKVRELMEEVLRESQKLSADSRRKVAELLDLLSRQ